MPKLAIVAALAALIATQAHAADMKLLIGGSMAAAFKTVGATFEKETGNRIAFIFDTTGALQKRLRGGEKADIVMVSAAGMDALQKEHLIQPGTRIDLARALIGVSVRKGSPVPDISTPETF
jgi:molybdate transport system substrate-binding protein